MTLPLRRGDSRHRGRMLGRKGPCANLAPPLRQWNLARQWPRRWPKRRQANPRRSTTRNGIGSPRVSGTITLSGWPRRRWATISGTVTTCRAPAVPLRAPPSSRPARHRQLAGRGLPGAGPTCAASVHGTSLRHHLWHKSTVLLELNGQAQPTQAIANTNLRRIPLSAKCRATTRRESQISRCPQL